MNSQMNKKAITSTDYNFSLLADPNKVKQENKTITVKSFQDKTHNNDSDSAKSNLLELDEEASDMNFADIKSERNSNCSSKSSRSSRSSNSSNSSKRRARFNNIREEVRTSRSEEYQNNGSNKPNPKNVVNYIHDNDDYDSLDENAQKIKRMDKFTQLMHLKKNGCELSKSYNINSDYWEMCAEIRFHTDLRNKQQGVELAKDGLVWTCTAIEFMNEKFDPFSINLKGWSDHVKLSKDNYTDVFNELYEKYKGSGRKIEPEVKLLLMLGASAATFHVSRSLAKSAGLESILKDNPELLAKLESNISSKINGPPQKSPEEIKKEMQFKMYQQMMNERNQQAQQPSQPSQQQQQQRPQQQQSQQQQPFLRPTQQQQQQQRPLQQQQQQQQQMPLQFSKPPLHNGPITNNTSINGLKNSILNKLRNAELSSNANINKITVPLNDEDASLSVSSVNSKARVSVTENIDSNSDSMSSINSEDLNITTKRRNRITVASS